MDPIASPEPPQEPVAASEPGAGRRRLRRLTLAVLAAGAIAAVVATAATAADGSATPSPGESSGGSSSSSPPSDGDRPELRKFGHPGFAMGMDLMGFGLALHGEAVVPDGDGGYETVVLQRGKVTDVGSDEITVESEDGFRQTYTVPAGALVNAARDGLSTIEKGNEVSVFAVRDGDDLTARRLVDLTKLEDLRERLMPRGFGPGDEKTGGMGSDVRLEVTVDAV